MAFQIMDSTSYDQIRAALDLSLDASSLPNAIIDQQIYGNDAEAEVIERDPLTLTYTVGSAARQRAINAAVLLTAARLAPSLPAISMERLGDWQESRTPPDLEKLAASLRGMAARQISANVNGASSVPLPAFWLGKAPCHRRGWRG